MGINTFLSPPINEPILQSRFEVCILCLCTHRDQDPSCPHPCPAKLLSLYDILYHNMPGFPEREKETLAGNYTVLFLNDTSTFAGVWLDTKNNLSEMLLVSLKIWIMISL